MASFAFLPCSGDVTQVLRSSEWFPSSTPHGASVKKATHAAEARAATAIHWALAVEEVTQPFVARGDAILKCVFCRQHYGAVLLESGVLLLLAPRLADQHGKSLMPQDTTEADEFEVVVDVSAGETHIVFCTLSGSVFSCGYDNRYGQLGDGSVWKMAEAAAGGGEEEVPPPLSSPRRLPAFGMQMCPASTHDQTLLNPSASASASSSSPSPAAHHARLLRGAEVGTTWYAPLNPSVESLAATQQRSAAAGMIKRKAQVSPSDVMITSVSCGAHHTLLLTLKRNAVYGCGRGHCGQISGPRLVLAQPVFRSLTRLFGLPIESISAAGHHSFVLLQTGRLLAFGENTAGQLGLGHTENVVTPTPVTFLGKGPTALHPTHATETTQDGHTHHPVRADHNKNTTPITDQSNASSRSAPPLEGVVETPPSIGLLSSYGDEYIAHNGTVVVRQKPSSVQSNSMLSLLPSRTLGGGAGGGVGHLRPPLLDDKAYASLRAPYNSVESTQFPLRVMRLSAECGPDEEPIAAVYACSELTVVRTRSMKWLSCGLPLSQGVEMPNTERNTTSSSSSASSLKPVMRADSRGPLGRVLSCWSEAYSFGPMVWPQELTLAMMEALESDAKRMAEAPTRGDLTEAPSTRTMADDEDEVGEEEEEDTRRMVEAISPGAKPPHRRGTNVPTASPSACYTGAMMGSAAAAARGEVEAEGRSPTGALPLNAIECYCYETMVVVGVRAPPPPPPHPPQPQTITLFTLSTFPTTVLTVQSGGDGRGPSSLSASTSPHKALAGLRDAQSHETHRTAPTSATSENETDGVRPGDAPGQVLHIRAIGPTATLAATDAEPPIRLANTDSDAATFHLFGLPQTLLATPKGILLM